ncbi:VOC family protein [Paucibacter sp. R3-3]|uniref:VOC family protein n=1 Tax=Roseateles agri TaxID=3098619 RepID=A0ABU5DQ28_9BURK|nr:VOC family protein [Paucibacter sp. R3-3]MDY0747147.1 VOC family protein [Paucibacter sp. R3-3]
MDVMKTHGAFSWSELMATDPAKAAEFYGSLFGWKIEEMPMPNGTYRVAKVGDTPVGGLMSCPDGSMPPMWGVYVTVDDVDAAIAKCTSLGGKVLMPPMEVPGVGRMAALADPQGAAFSVIKYTEQAS